MKTIHARLISAVLLVVAVVFYTIAVLSLDYTFVGDGFSPFKTWSPIQTSYFAIAALLLLSILILYNIQDRNPNLRGLIHTLPIIGLSFLIFFSMDSRQVLNYLPYLQVLFFDDFGSLFLFGGLLAIYLTYLISDSSHRVISSQNDILDFGIRSILVIFLGPILLGPVFYFGISVFLALGLNVFPYYGEGIIGSVLVTSVLLGMYSTARILSYLEDNDLPSLRLIRHGQVFKTILEFVTVYLCTAAGFSIVGGLVTDGVPLPEMIPLSIVVLGFYSVIPFSVLFTLRKVFPTVKEVTPTVDSD